MPMLPKPIVAYAFVLLAVVLAIKAVTVYVS